MSDRFVLFVDMLGFASLTLANADAVEELTATFRPGKAAEAFADLISRSEQPLLAKRFYGFHDCVDGAVADVQRNGGAAVAFSDSAFFAFDDFGRAVALSVRLMRQCIQARVPVRMGLARGSFRILRFLSDSSSKATVHVAQFLGTAVVGAYQAESCGIKGLRILIHPEIDDALCRGDGICASLLQIRPSRLQVLHEVNYLYRGSDHTDYFSGLGIANAAAMDEFYFPPALREMASIASVETRDHYDATEAAINAMRIQLDRPPLSFS